MTGPSAKSKHYQDLDYDYGVEEGIEKGEREKKGSISQRLRCVGEKEEGRSGGAF